jgi:CheY-like chemotaxis protein/two-component sensor histidine kinase
MPQRKGNKLKHHEPIKTEIGRDMPNQLESALLSHDLRSALSRVLSGSQALDAENMPKTAADYIAQIQSAALYMVELLNSADPSTTPAGGTNLPEALARLQAIWQPAVTQKGLEISFHTLDDIPTTLPLPRIDFMRILNNIIGNALKYSAAGSITVQLSAHGATGLLIEICDDGPGFSDDLHGRLFTLRGRPDTPKETGSGFGLYISKELIEQAGGHISAENRSSGGAKVSLQFPGDQRPQSAAPSPPNGLPDLSHLRILLAEDNPTNQMVATRMLHKMNAHVETAPDGVEAMAAFAKGQFDLGLIDIEMPRKSGLEVMREIRASGCTADDMKLIALTAYVLPEHKARIIDAGADGIIAKPLTDIAAFGNAILVTTGERPPDPRSQKKSNPDSDIDLDVYNGLKSIIGPDSMRELLEKVQADMADVKAGIQEGTKQKDAAQIRAKTHILISVAGAIGAINLQHVAETLNATAKTDNWAQITPESERCENGITDVLHFVATELDPH